MRLLDWLSDRLNKRRKRMRQTLRQAAIAVFLLVGLPQAATGQRPGNEAFDSLQAGLITHDEVIARAMVEDARTGDCKSDIVIQRHETLPGQAIPSLGIRVGTSSTWWGGCHG